MATYSFSTSSFKSELWINGKRVFKKPTGASVDFTNGGAFDWVFADSSGKVVKTYRAQNPNGGWLSVDLSSLGLFGDYSIGFRNASPGKREINLGEVHYFVVNWRHGGGPSRRQTASPGVLRPHEQPSRFLAASRSPCRRDPSKDH